MSSSVLSASQRRGRPDDGVDVTIEQRLDRRRRRGGAAALVGEDETHPLVEHATGGIDPFDRGLDRRRHRLAEQRVAERQEGTDHEASVAVDLGSNGGGRRVGNGLVDCAVGVGRAGRRHHSEHRDREYGGQTDATRADHGGPA
jgi:hypothetical protein